MLVQRARLALPAQAANPVEPALLVLVEVALYRARRDVGEGGDVGVGQPQALQPEHLHLALDAGMRVVVAVVAYLRQHFLAEAERAHGCLPAMGIDGYNHAVASRSPGGNSASLSRGEYSGSTLSGNGAQTGFELKMEFEDHF